LQSFVDLKILAAKTRDGESHADHCSARAKIYVPSPEGAEAVRLTLGDIEGA